jgi:hypothetical protein
MKLVIRTQFMENYGAHDWDGEGECPQYWKMKGGSEYMITDVPGNIDYQEVVDMAGVEKNNEYVREYILDWSIEDDAYLSWFEKSQLEYDGSIACPEPRIAYWELMVAHTEEYQEWAADADAQAYGEMVH